MKKKAGSNFLTDCRVLTWMILDARQLWELLQRALYHGPVLQNELQHALWSPWLLSLSSPPSLVTQDVPARPFQDLVWWEGERAEMPSWRPQPGAFVASKFQRTEGSGGFLVAVFLKNQAQRALKDVHVPPFVLGHPGIRRH